LTDRNRIKYIPRPHETASTYNSYVEVPNNALRTFNASSKVDDGNSEMKCRALVVFLACVIPTVTFAATVDICTQTMQLINHPAQFVSER
jgi:hypothetical protein